LLQVAFRDLRECQSGEVGVAEFQYARGEAEHAAVGVDVPEVGQGQQEAAGCRAGEVAAAGDLTECQLRVVGVEGADHGEAAFKRPDEVGLASGCRHRHLRRTHQVHSCGTLRAHFDNCQQYCEH
jgi:hypothetical protein